MSVQPPTSSEGSSLPPRQRPMLGSLAQDTTEQDLWAFDDLDAEEAPGAPEPPRIGGPQLRAFGADIPAPRERPPEKVRLTGASQVFRGSPGEESIRFNVNKVNTSSSSRPAGQASGPSNPEAEFDDLDQWDSNSGQAETVELPAAVAPESAKPLEQHKLPDSPKPEVVEEVAPAMAPAELAPAAAVDEVMDEFSPVVRGTSKLASLRPHVGLSKFESLGLLGLLVILIGIGVVVSVYTLRYLPAAAPRLEAPKFPVKGSRLTIDSAVSYWRVPITQGPSQDMFRRGTQLLPVLEVSVRGAPVTIRVMFRDQNHSVVGDAVTQLVREEGILKIPATAGFNDQGMYNAYRTGESKPWTVEVLEAPSEGTTGTDFKKLFEMDISTDRH